MLPYWMQGKVEKEKKIYPVPVIMVGPQVSVVGGISTHLKEILKFEQNTVNFVLFDWSTSNLNKVGSSAKKSIYRKLYGIKKTAQLLSSTKSGDIIHFHLSSYMGFYEKSAVALILKLLGRKVIATIHGGEFDIFLRRNSTLIIWILKRYHAVICVNDEHREKLSNHGVKKCFYVPNPIGTKDKIQKNKACSVDHIYGVWTGIFELRKQPLNFIRCIKKLVQENKKEDLRILVDMYGAGDYFEKAREELNNNIVSLHGSVENTKIREELKNYNVFFCTSKSESFGYSIAEAIESDLNIISTRVGILALAGDECFWPISNDLHDLDEAIKAIFQANGEELKRKRDRAKELISKYYTEDVFLSLQEIYYTQAEH